MKVTTKSIPSKLVIFLQMAIISLTTSSFLIANTTQSETLMTSYSYEEAKEKLEHIGETALLESFTTLSPLQQGNLLADVENLNVKNLEEQKRALKLHLNKEDNDAIVSYTPFNDCYNAGSESMRELGNKLLREGKVGCLLVAGGMGTRLSHTAPKGTFPVSPIASKSLFQLFSEKTVACSKQVGRSLPLAIMTSPQNHEATLAFFHEHNNFGLKEEQLFFFSQEEKPFLDNEGHLIIKDDGTIAKGPDGNGFSINLLVTSGILDTWTKLGVEYVNYILIDNPLADPFDAELIGFQAFHGSDITVKCVEKYLPDERVGVIVAGNEGALVVEYSEMDTKERYSTLDDGCLKHRCCNISLFCFTMPFIKKTSLVNNLPWHFAYKSVGSGSKSGWKFETYIFDHMKAATRIKALLYPREKCFAPLKNQSGSDSLETVQEALIKYDTAVLKAICDNNIDIKGPIELDQQFHYPTKELLSTWKGQRGPFQGYITPDYVSKNNE